jgi:predicted site-specific integrase-resolvase
MQQLLKPKEVAEIINVTVPTVMRWDYDGLIPARLHVGRIIRFELEPVMTALERASETSRANEFFRRRRPTRRTS